MKIFTALCGECANENRRAERLGTVRLVKATGRLVWIPEDPHFGRIMRKMNLNHGNDRGGVTLRLGKAVEGRYPFRPPEELPAYCRNHGRGTVRTVHVTDKRSRIEIVTFTADALRDELA